MSNKPRQPVTPVNYQRAVKHICSSVWPQYGAISVQGQVEGTQYVAISVQRQVEGASDFSLTEYHTEQSGTSPSPFYGLYQGGVIEPSVLRYTSSGDIPPKTNQPYINNNEYHYDTARQ